MFVDFQQLTLAEIKEKIKGVSPEEWSDLSQLLQADSRKGVQNLALSLQKKLAFREKEKNRLTLLQKRETELRAQGYQLIAGLDEAGRGPLAGPVVAASVIWPAKFFLPGLDDSKKMGSERRESLAGEIKKMAVAWAIGIANQQEIDQINIREATKKAMQRAVAALKVEPDYLLIDALELELALPQESVIKGDQKCASIAAASIIAKTERDRLMVLLDYFYPQYGFKKHKGYGTAEHWVALQLYGPSAVHRRSFLKNLAEK